MADRPYPVPGSLWVERSTRSAAGRLVVRIDTVEPRRVWANPLMLGAGWWERPDTGRWLEVLGSRRLVAACVWMFTRYYEPLPEVMTNAD